MIMIRRKEKFPRVESKDLELGESRLKVIDSCQTFLENI